MVFGIRWQLYCCQVAVEEGSERFVGACTSHAATCGSGIGIFLRVRDCKVLLIYGKPDKMRGRHFV